MPRFVDSDGVAIETSHPSTVVRLRNTPGVKEQKARTTEVKQADTKADKQAPK